MLFFNVHYFQAEADFERREKKKDDAKKRGEGTWMLPALSERIDQDELVR